MKIYFLHSVISGLRHNKLRTILTGLGIFIGVTSLITILTISNSFSVSVKEKLNHNIVIGLVSNVDINTDYKTIARRNEMDGLLERIRKLEGVLSFEQSQLKKKVDLQTENFQYKSGVDIGFNDDISVIKGRNFSLSTGRVVIASESKLDDFDSVYKICDRVTIGGLVYRIIGICNQTDKGLYFPTRLEDDLGYYEKADSLTYNLRLEDDLILAGNAEETINRALDILNEPLEGHLKFVNYDKALSDLTGEFLVNISLVLSIIAAISLIVSGINIINIMYISILERANEIAIYRALGMSKRMVVYIFLVESLFVVGIFSILGYIVAVIISYIIVTISGFRLYISLTSLSLLLLVNLLLGVGAGLKPAIKASKTNPTVLLR